MENQIVSITELLNALAKAQAEYPDIPKTRTGQDGNRKFKYADLNDIHKAIKAVNVKYFLAISHKTTDTHLVTTLYEAKTGQALATQLPLKLSENPKHTGATMTYLKRYNIQSLLDISTEEDLDAINTSEEGEKKPGNNPAPSIGKTPPVKPGNPQSINGTIAVGPKTGKTFEEVLKIDSAENFKMAKAISEALAQKKQCDPSYVAYMKYAMTEGVDL